MKTSETITKITPAFLEAQKKIESVIKDSKNPYFNSKYADLTSVIEACKDKLNEQSIAILQPIDGMNVETILVHTSGEWFSSSTPIVSKDEHNPQALGSAITYAKRYGLQSMVLLPAEDDDGQKASTPKKVVQAPAGGICSDCGVDGLVESIMNKSKTECGRVLCYACMQKDLEKIKKDANV